MNKEKKPPIHWTNLIVLTLTPLLTVILVPYYALTIGFTTFEWVMFVVFLYLTGLSISGGYHRLWSHKAYKAHPLVKLFYAFWGACNVENSVFHWASDHRKHHRYVDDLEKDPYCAKKGFFFSHMGWIIREYNSGKDDFSNIKDLLQDPILKFQHKFYVPLVIISNVVLPMAIGYAYNGNPWGMLLLCGLLRLVLNHHFTFFINSLAHIIGRQPFSNKNTSRDSHLLALFTYGEGYHNFHHSFQHDFRNGIKWWNFDPAKWMIRCLQFLGLAKDLKRTPTAQIKIAITTKQYQDAKAKAHKKESKKSDDFLLVLEEKYQNLTSTLNEWIQCKKEWLLAKKNNHPKHEIAELKRKYHQIRQNFKLEYKQWRALALAA